MRLRELNTSTETKNHFAHGKLMLTGEYAVLQGAKSLALPTKLGQNLKAVPTEKQLISWRSLSQESQIWFSGEFDLTRWSWADSTDSAVAAWLTRFFGFIKKSRPEIFNQGWQIKTKLDFDQSWGLGSSSTLTELISKWSGVDAFELNKATFNSSGYDIACAKSKSPILFQQTNLIEEAKLKWPFSDHLYFFPLSTKQNSRTEIKKSADRKPFTPAEIMEINMIGESLIDCLTLLDFETFLKRHDTIIAKHLRQVALDDELQLATTYTKYLGGWGGDMALAVGKNAREELLKAGYETILGFEELF